MATDILNDMFLRSTRLDDSQDPWLDSVVRRELAELAVSVPQWGDTGCSLANIGEFLVRSTTVLSHLANCVVYGEHIDTYTSRKIQEIEEETDFSELTFLEYLDDKHQSLKCVPHACIQYCKSLTDLPKIHRCSFTSHCRANRSLLESKHKATPRLTLANS